MSSAEEAAKDKAESKAMSDAITKAVCEVNPRMIPTRFVLLMVGLDENGNEAFWTVESNGLAPWDLKGLLHEAMDTELVESLWRMLKDEED